ncbi:hypothetical protein BN946_scf184594.g11 [Trametes cinnabarina]|uniref:Redoxin domain-containing protein n=1 Tax=Pycnoporus cinnabarinus TaxID=5643 RepID=A0A060SXF1_PYCCI|nr:hypothetical protein BN946_scf184594.g11 [Trametes cinnabarina]
MASLLAGATKTAHSLATSLLSVAEAKVGSTIPLKVPVKEDDPEKTFTFQERLKGKNVFVGVPGAFTGTCSAQVPGYIKAYDKFKEKGVENIYIVAVNDVLRHESVEAAACSGGLTYVPSPLQWLEVYVDFPRMNQPKACTSSLTTKARSSALSVCSSTRRPCSARLVQSSFAALPPYVPSLVMHYDGGMLSASPALLVREVFWDYDVEVLDPARPVRLGCRLPATSAFSSWERPGDDDVPA